ncbi:MAG: hypothetical protein ABGW98_16860, partial [Myxococcales bacterium]
PAQRWLHALRSPKSARAAQSGVLPQPASSDFSASLDETGGQFHEVSKTRVAPASHGFYFEQ